MNNIKIERGVMLHSNLIRSLTNLTDYFEDLPISIIDATDNSYSLGNADIFEIVKRISKAIESKECFIDHYVIYPKSDSVRVFVIPRDLKFETPGA